MNVTNLMTHSLKEHPEQRNFFKPIPVKEWPNFVDGIDLNGIIVPLFVSARDGVTVLDGHQRLTAARELGLETVPVVLREFETEADEVAFMVTVNDGRRHDSAETRAKRADYFLRRYVMNSDRLIAKMAGVSHMTVNRRRKALEADGVLAERENTKGRDGKTQKAKKSGVTPVTPEPVSLVSPKEIPNVMAFKLHKGVDAVLAVSDDDMRAFLQTGVTEHDRMIHKLTTLAAKLDRVLLPSQNAEPGPSEDTMWN
jgi:transposase